MADLRRMVCLANSRKLSGRCVAGKELASNGPGAWLRPVSARPSEEVSEYERQYQDGSDPQVLDIIDVPLISAKPNTYQPENWLLEPDEYWGRLGRLGWNDLQDLVNSPSVLWENGFSTVSGLNDRVPLLLATNLGGSLYMVHLQEMELSVSAPGAAFGNQRRRVQARFTFKGISYDLRVTDPVFERQYLAGSNGEFPISECYLTVSLGEPYDGFCYKFVAAITTPQRAQA